MKVHKYYLAIYFDKEVDCYEGRFLDFPEIDEDETQIIGPENYVNDLIEIACGFLQYINFNVYYGTPNRMPKPMKLKDFKSKLDPKLGKPFAIISLPTIIYDKELDDEDQ